MNRLCLVGLLLVLLSLSNLSAQTMNVSVKDWTTLKTELRIAQEWWQTSNGRIVSLENTLQQAILLQENSAQTIIDLEMSLQQARESQTASEQTINDLEMSLTEARALQEALETRIRDLEMCLQEASEQREQSQSLIESLEKQLTELGTSLIDIQSQLDQNEEDHIGEIKGLVVNYERRLTIRKVLLLGVLVVAVGEGAYILIDLLIP